MDHTFFTDDQLEELERDADQAVVAVDADALRRLAEEAQAAALRRIRMRFHARWGFFIKCVGCGGRVDQGLHGIPCRHCNGRVTIATGYRGPG